MGYSLEPDETVRDSIRRIVRELGEQTISLAESDDDFDVRIHEIRKNFKRIRAAFRLVRDAFEDYSPENARYRDAGRLLSDLRDAAARIETIDALADELAEATTAADVDALRATLVDARDREFAQADVSQLLEEVADRTREGLDALDSFDLTESGFDAIRGGLARSYRRGANRLEEAKSGGDAETFHTWRKRTKYHRYHVDMLEPLWSPERSGWEQALHNLTDDLGRANDLAVLQRFLDDHPDAAPADDSLRSALQRAEREARSRAIERGEEAYAASPEDLVSRFEDHWDAWQSR